MCEVLQAAPSHSAAARNVETNAVTLQLGGDRTVQTVVDSDAA